MIEIFGPQTCRRRSEACWIFRLGPRSQGWALPSLLQKVRILRLALFSKHIRGPKLVVLKCCGLFRRAANSFRCFSGLKDLSREETRPRV